MAPCAHVQEQPVINAIKKSLAGVTIPKSAMKRLLQLKPRKISTASPIVSPITPSTLENPSLDLSEPSTTPVKQIMTTPKTPMAPKQSKSLKRRHSETQELLDLDTSPSQILNIITTTAASIESTVPNPFESPLKRQGLAIFTPNNPNKRIKRESQELLRQHEQDASVTKVLKSLVGSGRRVGGSPSYTFCRGRSSVRYEYMPDLDKEYEPVDTNPRERLRDGSPLSVADKKSLHKMFHGRPCHVPETIDVEV